MARQFLTGGAGNNAIKHFSIRLEEDHLILRGTRDEAASVVLKGTVVLCCSESIKTNGIQLTFKGHSETSFPVTNVPNAKYFSQHDTFLVKRWEFHGEKPGTVAAGNHEWPFELVLDGGLPESVEGLGMSGIFYRLKATVTRGILAKDVVTRKSVRLIRTFDPSSLELSHNMGTSSVWPKKIQYDISSPSKAVVYGTKARVDFVLIPLLKGLIIGKVRSTIIENQKIVVDLKDSQRSRDFERTIATDIFQIPDYVEAGDVDGQEGYKFSRYLQLPRSLFLCRQSVQEKNITIKHRIKFTVTLHNPDGHVSELRLSHPLQIFISPEVRLDEHDEIANEISSTQDLIEDQTLAPPSYGNSGLDPIYEGVDRGFVTPTAPSTPYDQSRRGSFEELDGRVVSNELSAKNLRNRLTNLNMDQETTDPSTGRRSALSGPSSLPEARPVHQRNNSYPALGIAAPIPPATNTRQSRSTPSSRRNSDDDTNGVHNYLTPPLSSGTATPLKVANHLEFGLDDDTLSRVPSYNTALHAHVRPLSYHSAGATNLPDYFSLEGSRPPTPSSGDDAPSTAPQTATVQASSSTDTAREPNSTGIEEAACGSAYDSTASTPGEGSSASAPAIPNASSSGHGVLGHRAANGRHAHFAETPAEEIPRTQLPQHQHQREERKGKETAPQHHPNALKSGFLAAVRRTQRTRANEEEQGRD